VNLTDPLSPDSLPNEEAVPLGRALLSEEQAVRAVALAIAKPFLTATGVVSKSAPEVGDLITLAEWIVEGGDKSPLYPYADNDGTLHLGPATWLVPGGDLWANGNLYEPSSDDGHADD
jgi:hypothetical protein